MIQRFPDELQIWGTEEGFASSAEPPLPIHLSSQIGLPLPDPLGGRLVFQKCLPSPAFHPKLPLHCQNQSNPAEHRRDYGHDPKRPSAEQMECIAGASRGKSQDQETLADPMERARGGGSCLPRSPLFTINPPGHIALRVKSHASNLVGLGADVASFQSVGCRILSIAR